MTLPSTTPQPSPANSTAHPPSGRNVRPEQSRTDAPKHRRGGQPGNQNARTLGAFSTFQPGPLCATRARIHDLHNCLKDQACPPARIIEQARSALQELDSPMPGSKIDVLPAMQLIIKLSGIISRASMLSIPDHLCWNALESIACDPFGYFERGYKDCGISRDADSFFFVSKLSARNSPLPPDHPSLATNLTDKQWAVLAPLIPPDPVMDWLTGEPPVIIAASRWGFTQYCPTNEFNDFVIMQNYHQVLQRCPALTTPSQVASPAKRRCRPRTSPRTLLDAIFWKLATGQTWDALPPNFPPLRLCRKYYRRLFLSGRLYTLLLALYNHMRLEAAMDLTTLLEAGVFTTTPGQNIALSLHAPPTWQNYTALLFMQLAREAYSRLECNRKQEHPIYPLLPVFKGNAQLSTGKIPGLESQEPTPTFQPLEISPAWSKWRNSEHDQKTIAREVSKRLRNGDPPASFDAASFFLDEEFGP